MELQFEREIPKNKQVGIRLTVPEYQSVKGIAKRNKVTMAEATRQLVIAALKETNNNG